MANALRVSGVTGDGYAEQDFTAVPEVYLTMDVRFPAFYISYVNANPFSSEIVQVADNGAINSVDWLFLEAIGGGQAAIYVNSAAASFGVLDPAVWYTLELRVRQAPDQTQLWIDGVSVYNGAVAMSGADIGQVIVGLFFANTDPDQQFDIDNVSIGTTQGGAEIMGPADFENGLIVPPFTTDFDSSGTGASIFIVTYPGPPTPGTSNARIGVFIDEIEVTEFCVEGSVTKRLNGAATASVKLNMRMAASSVLWGTAYPGAGSYLKVYVQSDTNSSPVLWHHGRILNCETSADENSGYTVFNSTDPLELWAHRPVRDPPDIVLKANGGYGNPGNFSKPYLLEQFGNPTDDPGVNGAPRVVWAMMDGSEGTPATIPSQAEGPLRLQRGGYAAGAVTGGNVKGAPKDWPMTMAEMASNLTSTGICDIIVTPIEMTPSGDYGEVNVYNGDFGTDLSASVAFQYGLGAFNVRALRWNEDMTNLCNKLWYYLGPKCDDQHWPANITGDDPAFNPDAVPAGAWAAANNYVQDDLVTNNGASFVCILDNLSSAANEPGTPSATGIPAEWEKFWVFWRVPPGGRRSPTSSATNNPLGVNIMNSRGLYDARMDIRIFDGVGGEPPCVEGNVINHDMWRWQWQNEAWLRAYPRNLVHITPTRDTAIGEFDIGDLVLVEASAEVKGGFSGVQRIYQYTISWDSAQSVPAISELQTSSDGEGFLP